MPQNSPALWAALVFMTIGFIFSGIGLLIIFDKIKLLQNKRNDPLWGIILLVLGLMFVFFVLPAV